MSTRAQVPLPTPKVVKELAGVQITSMSDSFAADFPELASGMKNFVTNLVNGQSGNRPRTARSNSIESRRLEQGARELFDQTEAQGWQVTMVINMNPWPIKVNGVLHDEVLPACPSVSEWRQSGRTGKPYAHVLLDMWAQDVRDKGDGVWTHHPFMPMQLAKDYINECAITKWGGVFFYPSPYLPDDPNMPADLKGRVDIEWAAAEKKLLAWARMMFNIADRAYNSPNGDKRIVGDLERKAAVWLLDHGYITEARKPRWVDVTHDEALTQKECPSCFNKVDQQAILCGNGRCTFVFDPRKAYTDGLIDDTHPSLRRLTRAELDELELQHVKSIAHLAGVVKAVPVVSAPAEDPAEKFANGEELTEAEMEKLTAPEPEAPKPQTKAEKKKSDQQKKAEASLE